MAAKNVTTLLNLQIPIDYPDIIAWLNECKDPSMLRNVGIIAMRYAHDLENRPKNHPDFNEGKP